MEKNISECWISFIKPFGTVEKQNKVAVEEYQKQCIQNNIFGIGWHYPSKPEYIKATNEVKNLFKKLRKQKEKIEAASLNDIYVKAGVKNWDNSAKNALEEMIKIENLIREQNEVLVLTRLVNGKYYIGKVTEVKPSDGEDNIEKDYTKSRLSWIGKVEEWKEFERADLPGHIIGRLSQRRHSTLNRIANSITRTLVNLCFNNYGREIKEEDKIVLSESDYTDALNYMELEDLVYSYIMQENENYILYPSECKISEVKYEFYLVNKNDISKTITCQVKNREAIKYSDYLEDAKNNRFEKIYLFSGIENYIDEEKEKNDNIKVIKKEELFNYLYPNLNTYEEKNENAKVVKQILLDKINRFYTNKRKI